MFVLSEVQAEQAELSFAASLNDLGRQGKLEFL
jgi:hypothetical protein